MKKVTFKHAKHPFDFLAGGGEMGALMRSKDWSETLVGPIENWPQSLKTAVRTLLDSKFAMFLWWGPDLIQFYNDAYRPSLGKAGEKHPQALGQRGEDCWGEIWPIIKPQIDQVMQQGIATWNVNHLVPIYRNNILEEVYWTYSYSAIYEESGKVGGVLVTVTETTQQVIGERQLALLHELTANAMNARTVEESCNLSAKALETNPFDIPFALLYLLNPEKKSMELACVAGIPKHHEAALQSIPLSTPSIWSFEKVISAGKSLVHSNLALQFPELPKGAWEKPPTQAVVISVSQTGQSSARGALVVGLNPMRIYDDNYQRFLTLVAGQIGSNIGNAQAYEEERRRNEALAEIDRAKTVFFSNVSHEFRTPLSLMLGPLQEMLGTQQLQRDRRTHLEVVYRNGLRLQKLVNTLLDFSRIEAGRIQANYVPTDLSAFTAELASNFRSAIEKAGMELIVKTHKLSEKIYVDRDLWEKIVLNLLSNAFKFTFKGKIEVQLKEVKHYAVLSVCDTGEGISKNDLPHIFERFKRIEGVKSRTVEGSGIGLALVQDLVRLHGGTIQVKSNPGKGTTFTIRLPKGKNHLPEDRIESHSTLVSTSIDARVFINEAEHWLLESERDHAKTEAHDHQQQPNEAVLDKPHIILADDNADMRNYVKRLLSERFNVKSVSNGKQALREIQKEIPDLLLTDIMMPEMDGFALLKTLKANPHTASIPVMILSARAGEEAKTEGIAAGADDYLVKPFNAHALVARVSALITANRTRRETENRLYGVFMQAPAIIAVLEGPQHIFKLGNPMYMQLVGKDRDIIGKPVAEALPEIKEQGFIELLDQVYKTGEPFIGNEIPAKLDRHGNGKLERVCLNFIYHPYKNAEGKVEGIIAHGVDVSEQVKAREKIAESEKKYRSIFETAEVSLWEEDFTAVKEVIDELKQQGVKDFRKYFNEHPEFVERAIGLIRVSDVNQETVKMFEAKDKSELIGSLQTIFTPETTSVFIEELIAVAEGRTSMQAEALLKTVKGNPVYVLFTMKLPLPSEKFDRVLFSVVNITDRKKAEESLRKSKEYYKTMTDNTPVMTWISRPDGWCTFLNKQWYDYTGQTPATGLGVRWLEALHPEDAENVSKIFQKANQKQVSFSLEYRLKDKNNQYRWHMGSGLPKFDEQGNFEGFIGSVIDIHERKIADEQLRESEEKFRTMANNMPQLAWMTDENGWIYWYNQRWYEYTGTTLKEMQGWGWQKVHHPDTVERVVKKIKKAFDTGSYWEDTFPLRSKEGEYRTFLSRAFPLKNADGTIKGWFGTNTDITERESLAKQKDEFIGIASHELKTPLTSVKAYIQIIEELYKEKSYDELGNLIQRALLSTNKLATLIGELLDISRIQAGKMQYDFSEFKVEEIINNCIGQLKLQNKTHHIIVTGDLSVMVYGDKLRLEQVVDNLLLNAIKYSPKANKVLLDVSNENGELKISITDFGIGISQKNLSNIFERFFRVDQSAHQFQGLGLGLYISNEIVKRHGGKISVESVVGKGSTFYFTIPMKQKVKKNELQSIPMAEALEQKKFNKYQSSK